MSRIGRLPIPIPSGVSVEARDGALRVRGPKGELAQPIPRGIRVEIGDGTVRFQREDDRKPTRALHGLARALTANMVKGVTQGFTRQLSIVGVGYRAEVSGRTLRLALGFSHPVEMAIPEGVKVSVEKNTELTLEGNDKAVLGQFAADIRSIRPPEPYKGKGVRYTGEHVRRKVGKAGAAGSA
jgi:large subunit ribosomal protein L6